MEEWKPQNLLLCGPLQPQPAAPNVQIRLIEIFSSVLIGLLSTFISTLLKICKNKKEKGRMPGWKTNKQTKTKGKEKKDTHEGLVSSQSTEVP